MYADVAAHICRGVHMRGSDVAWAAHAAAHSHSAVAENAAGVAMIENATAWVCAYWLQCS